MGFRNPLTPVARTLATADSGTRVVISRDEVNRVRFYTGDPDEVAPGVLDVGMLAGATPAEDRGFVTLTPPQLAAEDPADPVYFSLYGRQRGGAAGYTQVGGRLVKYGRAELQDFTTVKALTWSGDIGWITGTLAAGWTRHAFAWRRSNGYVEANIEATWTSTTTTWAAGQTLATFADKPLVNHRWQARLGLDVVMVTDGRLVLADAQPAGIRDVLVTIRFAIT